MSWRDRNMEEVKVEPSDPFMGKDKERKNFFVKVSKITNSPKYGKVHVIEDRSERRGIFFKYTTKGEIPEARVDDCIIIHATCNHGKNSLDGQDQTYFNRVQLIKNVGSTEDPITTNNIRSSETDVLEGETKHWSAQVENSQNI